MINPANPVTQRELKKAKKSSQAEQFVTIYNVSKQMVQIQLSPPAGMDFYRGEQTVPLYKGKSGKFPMSRIKMHQIENLQKSGKIRIENMPV